MCYGEGYHLHRTLRKLCFLCWLVARDIIVPSVDETSMDIFEDSTCHCGHRTSGSIEYTNTKNKHNISKEIGMLTYMPSVHALPWPSVTIIPYIVQGCLRGNRIKRKLCSYPIKKNYINILNDSHQTSIHTWTTVLPLPSLQLCLRWNYSSRITGL